MDDDRNPRYANEQGRAEGSHVSYGYTSRESSRGAARTEERPVSPSAMSNYIESQFARATGEAPGKRVARDVNSQTLKILPPGSPDSATSTTYTVDQGGPRLQPGRGHENGAPNTAAGAGAAARGASAPSTRSTSPNSLYSGFVGYIPVPKPQATENTTTGATSAPPGAALSSLSRASGAEEPPRRATVTARDLYQKAGEIAATAGVGEAQQELIFNYEDRIRRLERELASRDREIALLQSQCLASETDNRLLAQEIRRLRTRILANFSTGIERTDADDLDNPTDQLALLQNKIRKSMDMVKELV